MWPLGRESTEAGVPCPLLVFEAPEFLWNRDIFCVTNGEMSSLLCAATAGPHLSVRSYCTIPERCTRTHSPHSHPWPAHAHPW
jgi:hypothetical protein